MILTIYQLKGLCNVTGLFYQAFLSGKTQNKNIYLASFNTSAVVV